MAHNRRVEVIGALALIGAGLLFLLGNLGFLHDVQPIVWSGLFFLGGLLFLVGYAGNRSEWWPLIPGSGLLGVGAIILLSGVLHVPGELAGAGLFICLAAGFGGVYLAHPRENWWALIPGGAMLALTALVLLSEVAGELGGSVFFAGMGLVFVALYFAEIDGQRYQWWALIPAGALLSLAAVVALAAADLGVLSGSALFLGLGLTFAVLYFMRGPNRPLEWAWIPSLALFGFGGLILLVSGASIYARLFWPVAFIGAGAILFVRAWQGRS